MATQSVYLCLFGLLFLIVFFVFFFFFSLSFWGLNNSWNKTKTRPNNNNKKAKHNNIRLVALP